MSVFADMLVPVYAALGEDMVYADRAGGTATVRVLADRSIDRFGDGKVIDGAAGIFAVRRAEVAELPRRDETFTDASGRVYVVAAPANSDDIEHRVFVR